MFHICHYIAYYVVITVQYKKVAYVNPAYAGASGQGSSQSLWVRP